MAPERLPRDIVWLAQMAHFWALWKIVSILARFSESKLLYSLLSVGRSTIV